MYHKYRHAANFDEPYNAFIKETEASEDFYVHYFKRGKENEMLCSVGKWLRQLELVDDYTDADLEKYVNKLKAKFVINETFEIVEGENIRYWYYGGRYARNTGSLENSCMRHDQCQSYFDIYVENPVKMLILKNNHNRLVGRALLWPRSMWNKNYFDNCDFFMDRIYGDDRVIQKFKIYANDNNWAFKSRQTYSDELSVFFRGESFTKRMRMNLEDYGFDSYPYMDTFNRMVDGHLKNHGDGDMLTETDGTYREPYAHCNQCGCALSEDDARYCESEYEYYCEDHSVWSEWYEYYIPYNQGGTYETNDGWLYQDDIVNTECGESYHEDNTSRDILDRVWHRNDVCDLNISGGRWMGSIPYDEILRDRQGDRVFINVDGYRMVCIDVDKVNIDDISEDYIGVLKKQRRWERGNEVIFGSYLQICQRMHQLINETVTV